MNNSETNNALSVLMGQQRKGKMLSEASEKLQKLVQMVQERGKAGTLTIKFKVSPANGEGALNVFDDVEVKFPKPEATASIFYSTDDGVLVRNNPNQSELKLAVVEKEPARPLPVAVNQ